MIASVTTTILAEGTMTSTSTGEAVQFWILGTLAVISALGVVAAPKAVYSALFLAMTMIILAVFYIVQGALFLGVVQVVVYTGAVMMLFLFVLMLVGVDSSDSLVETLRGQRVSAIVIGVGFGLLLIGGLGNASISGFTGFTGLDQGNIDALADLIFIRYVWAFELTGALLITATLGAMSDPDKGSATPLPSPGVYARHNAVDMPALLPDGTFSTLSVSSALTPRSPDPSTGEESAR